MEKFGDMLEAAAETAIPASTAVAPKAAVPKSWEQWEAASLLEFMAEEVGGGWTRGRGVGVYSCHA